jgi:hypothetical protein
MVDKHPVRRQVMGWAMGVCERSPLFSGVQGKQLQLVRQEMSMADVMDPSYSNPFSEDSLREQKAVHMQKHKVPLPSTIALSNQSTYATSLHGTLRASP